MRYPRFVCCLTAALALSCPLSPRLPAQNVLYAEYDGQMRLVRGASDTRPIVEFNGKRTVTNGLRLALQPAEEYLPVFVSVRNIEVTNRSVEVAGSGRDINNELHFRAKFESPFGLDNVYVVLDLRGESRGRMFFIYEIGRLDPREPKAVAIYVPMAFSLGSGKFTYHVFVDGFEVLHSGIPIEKREAALDRMVARRIASVQDGPPQLFIGPAPEYPARLRKAKVNGRAVITVRVTAAGRVVDPAVKEATDPAFGAAALDAVRLWRFLPRVQNGRPVEALANIPFAFAPPEPGGK